MWLLCHRWISDGVCLQRNGCVNYQEPLKVEVLSSNTGSTGSSSGTGSSTERNKIPSVRFRGNRILGQFPRHLHAIFGPLLEESHHHPHDKKGHKPLIHIQAQALMEDRNLPIGVDVALAVWYVPPVVVG